MEEKTHPLLVKRETKGGDFSNRRDSEKNNDSKGTILDKKTRFEDLAK